MSTPAASSRVLPTPAATDPDDQLPDAPPDAPPTSPSPATITEPVKVDSTIDPNIPVATPRRRPPGRPPRNSRWDAASGQYLPVLTTVKLPSPARIWALVTRRVSDDPRCPNSVAEALNGPDKIHWRRAIDVELACIAKYKTWRAIYMRNMPPGAKMIKTKWVFKIKRDSSGRIVRYKARLTA